MDNLVLLVVAYSLVVFIMIFLAIVILKKSKLKEYRLKIEELDKVKNEIESAPVVSEIVKIETIVKNEHMEEKYKRWYEDFDNIKQIDVSQIEDLLIDMESKIEDKLINSFEEELVKAEMLIYEAKEKVDYLLSEIKEVNLSEEKYRKVITKLKIKYRSLYDEFEGKKIDYDEIVNAIELQFEHIERLFQDFEYYMDENNFQEIFHIVKGIDKLIEHMEIVIHEVPDLILLTNRIIPKRIEQITEVYEDLKSKKYPLKHLKIEYNVEESLKNTNMILDRIKVLNLENCMFELKTMLEYLDNLFDEFEKEKISKTEYEQIKDLFENKLEKRLSSIEDLSSRLDEIKSMYELSDDDIDTIKGLNRKVSKVNDEYRLYNKSITRKKVPYSERKIKLEEYLSTFKSYEEEIDAVLKTLGHMYDDEERAREQLDEIQELLKQSKAKIRSYKLPIISDSYFTELEEANEAILEVIKELENKPIKISILNTRVDTARDLVLKLYNTTNKLIKIARLSEYVMIYGNRYRNDYIELEEALRKARNCFYKGQYEKSLEVSINELEKIDKNIRKKVHDAYQKVN